MAIRRPKSRQINGVDPVVSVGVTIAEPVFVKGDRADSVRAKRYRTHLVREGTGRLDHQIVYPVETRDDDIDHPSLVRDEIEFDDWRAASGD